MEEGREEKEEDQYEISRLHLIFGKRIKSAMNGTTLFGKSEAHAWPYSLLEE